MELKISKLYKVYKGIEGEPNFTLHVPAMNFELGKIVYILGPNGSGKSVTIKLLAGEILPSIGYVRFDLNGVSWKANDRPSGIVRQKAEDSLAMSLTVRENLLLRSRPKHFLDKLFPSSRLIRQLEGLLESQTILLRKLDQPCNHLSGGQRQALAFLGVASQNIPILFLDEFLAATDQSTSNLLRRLAKEYAERVPACVFIVSHDIKMALAEADRIIVLKDGQLLLDLAQNDQNWDEAKLADMIR